MGLLIEIAGWIGAALILLAYLLNSTHRIATRSAAYQWINIVGALGILINSAAKHALPSAALNLIWMVIGLIALRQNSRAR